MLLWMPRPDVVLVDLVRVGAGPASPSGDDAFGGHIAAYTRHLPVGEGQARSTPRAGGTTDTVDLLHVTEPRVDVAVRAPGGGFATT